MLSMKLLPFCMPKNFQTGIRICLGFRVFGMFFLSLRLMIDKSVLEVDGDSLETLSKIFLTLIKMFTLLVNR